MNELLENVQTQMRKGLLDYCILLIIKQHSEAYTNEILERLKQANLIVVEGTIYPLLSRLKNGDYLSYRWVESTEGPPRKYFQLTSKGEELLTTLDVEWNTIVQSINTIKTI